MVAARVVSSHGGVCFAQEEADSRVVQIQGDLEKAQAEKMEAIVAARNEGRAMAKEQIQVRCATTMDTWVVVSRIDVGFPRLFQAMKVEEERVQVASSNVIAELRLELINARKEAADALTERGVWCVCVFFPSAVLCREAVACHSTISPTCMHRLTTRSFCGLLMWAFVDAASLACAKLDKQYRELSKEAVKLRDAVPRHQALSDMASAARGREERKMEQDRVLMEVLRTRRHP